MSYTDIAKVVKRSVTCVRNVCLDYLKNKPSSCINCRNPKGLSCVRMKVKLWKGENPKEVSH